LRHFLTGSELTSSELAALLERAAELKEEPDSSQALAEKSVALIFERPSTRARVSFEVGVAGFGGHPVVLRSDEMQLSRGESPRDTALVLSRHVDAIAIRTGPDELVEELAQYASVPVINMLTAGHHPTQALADLQTLNENYGHLNGLTLAYVGDGNNVARSLAILGRTAGVNVRIASPEGFELEPVAEAFLTTDPSEAVQNADAVYADVWVSMNDDPQTAEQRRRSLEPYRLDETLLDQAAPHAFALHCLPAHPGEEISEGLLYGERQRIWDQAENRRHAQKALLEFLIG
jgi:ornithine carbamoyltransferase